MSTRSDLIVTAVLALIGFGISAGQGFKINGWVLVFWGLAILVLVVGFVLRDREPDEVTSIIDIANPQLAQQIAVEQSNNQDSRVKEREKLGDRPIVVPVRFGKITAGPEAGHTGITLRNDGRGPAYNVVPVERVEIPKVGHLVAWGTPCQLRPGEPDIHFPVSRELPNENTLGSGLYDFMVKHDVDKIVVPFTYRDTNDEYWQTDVILIKDQMQRSVNGSESGIRVDWRQKQITEPTWGENSLSKRCKLLGQELFNFVKELGPAPEVIIDPNMTSDEAWDHVFKVKNDGRVEKVHHGYMRRFKDRTVSLLHELGEHRVVTGIEHWEAEPSPSGIQREKTVLKIAESLMQAAATIEIRSARESSNR